MSFKILVIDDEPDLLELIQDELEHLGYSSCSAPDAVAGFEIIENDPCIGLVLSDVMMARMSGIELAKKIHQSIPSKPAIILLTGMNNLHLEELETYGVRCVLEKPIDFDRLKEIISEIIVERDRVS